MMSSLLWFACWRAVGVKVTPVDLPVSPEIAVRFVIGSVIMQDLLHDDDLHVKKGEQRKQEKKKKKGLGFKYKLQEKMIDVRMM